jgi:hypothetical protein
VSSGKRGQDYEGIGEVERRDGEQQPKRIEREEGPEVETRRPVAPPQQVHALHRLAVHLEPRHAGAAATRIGERCGATVSLRSGPDVDQRGDTSDSGRVYRLGSMGLDRQWRPAVGGGRRAAAATNARAFGAAAASLRGSTLRPPGRFCKITVYQKQIES